MSQVDKESLTQEQRELLDRLPAETEIYADPIVCRKGTWYTVQTPGRVLSRDDRLTVALTEAIKEFADA